MIRFEGINTIGEDAYFIRLSNLKNHYIHFEGDNPKDESEVVYRVKEGTKGACVWRKKEGEEFIKYTGKNNLELVSVKSVLGNDGSLN